MLNEGFSKGVDLCLENADTWLNEGYLKMAAMDMLVHYGFMDLKQ